VQVRTSDASRISHQSDFLSPLHGVANCDERFAQVKVRRDDSGAVIDVDHIARQKEIVDERNYATISCAYRLPYSAPEVHAEMPRSESAVEQAA
jgi:hypothetical protein